MGLRKTIFGRQKDSYNTYIGGVAATLGTPALLATKLGISTANISGFSIVGADIKCTISVSYSIPNSAFYQNTNITSYLDLGNKVTELLYYAFREASNLSAVQFNAVYKARNSALAFTAISVVNLPMLTVIEEDNILRDCYNLTYVNLPIFSGILNGTFRNCTSLLSVNIPLVSEFNEHVFNGCISLLNFYSTSITRIGQFSFRGTTNLEIVEVPNCVLLENSAFYITSGIQEFIAPNLTTITGNSTFRRANRLTNLYIPKCNILGATTGSDKVFLEITVGCHITIDSSMQTINAGAVEGDLNYAISSRSATVTYVIN